MSGKKEWHFEQADLSRSELRALRRQAREGARATEVVSSTRDARLPATSVPVYGNGLAEGGWWNLFPARVEPHRATTKDIAAIYPFVADAGIGTLGPILGVDLNADSLFCFSPWDA